MFEQVTRIYLANPELGVGDKKEGAPEIPIGTQDGVHGGQEGDMATLEKSKFADMDWDAYEAAGMGIGISDHTDIALGLTLGVLGGAGLAAGAAAAAGVVGIGAGGAGATGLIAGGVLGGGIGTETALDYQDRHPEPKQKSAQELSGGEGGPPKQKSAQELSGDSFLQEIMGVQEPAPQQAAKFKDATWATWAGGRFFEHIFGEEKFSSRKVGFIFDGSWGVDAMYAFVNAIHYKIHTGIKDKVTGFIGGDSALLTQQMDDPEWDGHRHFSLPEVANLRALAMAHSSSTVGAEGQSNTAADVLFSSMMSRVKFLGREWTIIQTLRRTIHTFLSETVFRLTLQHD